MNYLLGSIIYIGHFLCTKENSFEPHENKYNEQRDRMIQWELTQINKGMPRVKRKRISKDDAIEGENSNELEEKRDAMYADLDFHANDDHLGSNKGFFGFNMKRKHNGSLHGRGSRYGQRVRDAYSRDEGDHPALGAGLEYKKRRRDYYSSKEQNNHQDKEWWDAKHKYGMENYHSDGIYAGLHQKHSGFFNHRLKNNYGTNEAMAHLNKQWWRARHKHGINAYDPSGLDPGHGSGNYAGSDQGWGGPARSFASLRMGDGVNSNKLHDNSDPEWMNSKYRTSIDNYEKTGIGEAGEYEGAYNQRHREFYTAAQMYNFMAKQPWGMGSEFMLRVGSGLGKFEKNLVPDKLLMDFDGNNPMNNKLSKSFNDGIFSQNGHYEEISSDCDCHFLPLINTSVAVIEPDNKY